MKKCKSLGSLAKALLVASPTLTGSLPRIPFGPNIGKTGGKGWASIFLVLSILGMVWNTFLAFTTLDDLETMEDFSGLWFMWFLGGAFAGFGIATFPMIINVLFWSKISEAGSR